MSTATFTRASTAYKRDGSVVASGLPRYEDGVFGQAIMVEPSTSNLCSIVQLFNPLTYNSWSAVTNNTLAIGTYTISFKYSNPSGGSFLVSSTYNTSNMYYVSVPVTAEIQSYRRTFTTGTTNEQISFFGVTAGNVITDIQVEFSAYGTSYHPTARNAEVLAIPADTLVASAGTLCGWFEESLPPSGVSQYIFDATAGAGRFYLRRLYASATEIYHDGGFNNAGGITSTLVPPVNGFAHIALTWSGSSVIMYRNGVSVATLTTASPVVFTGVTSIYLGSANNSLAQLNGCLDDVRIYNEALSPTAILALYKGGL